MDLLTALLADLATPEGEEWQDRALCAQTDPEAFYSEDGSSTREAKRICLGCEVKDDCLEYALEHRERFGVWGGLSERERRHLLEGRPNTAAKTAVTIGRLLRLGIHLDDIADRAGVSRRTVERQRRRLGLTTTNQKGAAA
jgi:WhiB family transcriptional regulator, redox-sensing transcriptional regulator